MVHKIKLKDKYSNRIYNVYARHEQKIPINSITETKKVIFGKIDGKGKEYAFRIPTRFREVK